MRAEPQPSIIPPVTARSAGLRNTPRQKRSEDRISQILDAADRVVERMGYDATTTNHVAAEAQISVGTVYRWFPDKDALTTAMAERHTQRLAEAIAGVVVDDPSVMGPTLIRQLVEALATFFAANPSLVAIVRAAGPSGTPGALIRDAMGAQIEGILQARIPDIPEGERRTSGQGITSITLSYLSHPDRSCDDRDWVDDLWYAVTAYVRAKYPPADDPAWKAPEERHPQPVRAALPSDGRS